MKSDYRRRQQAGHWPAHKRWNPAELPEWYRDLIGAVAANLTAWREHDPPQRLDPRCDPRGPQRHVERRACARRRGT